MKYGLSVFITEESITPGELAVEAEARGFESLWFAEHSHIPVSRRTPWPGGAELPRFYYEVMDPFVCMASAAAASSTIRLGTGVALVAQRDVIQLAKAIASLDVLSGGRVNVGVGGGWNIEEMENHGTDPSRRFKRLREGVEAMKAIWTNEEAAYHGELIDFDPIFQFPKPVQKPHPPVFVGGAAPAGIRRALRYGDHWMPLMGRGDSDFASHMDTFRAMAEEAGRDASKMEVSVYGAPLVPEELERYENAGISRVIFFVPPVGGRDGALPALDRYAGLKEKVGA